MNSLNNNPVLYVYQNLQNEEEAQNQINQIDLNQALLEFRNFFQTWLINNQKVYILSMNQAYEQGKKAFNVYLEDINIYTDHYYQYLIDRPNDFIPILERAASEAFFASTNRKYEFQVLLISTQNPKNLRDIKASQIGKLITVSGIITQASKPYIRSKEVYIECSKCHHQKSIEVSQGLGSLFIPAFCERQGPAQDKCPRDTYVIIIEKCTYFDQQRLKLQETPECIPTGEIPRAFSLCVERNLINKFTPGTKVILTGIYQVLERKVLTEKYISQNQHKMNYIQVVGYQLEDEIKRKSINFTNSEEEKFKEMAKDPQIFEKVSNSISPSIYGHENIKKSLACLLFGGSKKELQDGIKLRGDINVLLIGDPSTGKSQFLKFVQRIAPNAIYTSGKGSSASGLTASITRDLSTGEFQIEGGAMVLADGGVVCIDEFDKMRAEDRVAIHEAMEQQTVSVAKAGITTKLNTRCSVLAAANPIFGSYNDIQSVEDQIELQTTILSRFDCIFVVRDPKTRDIDSRIAEHILNLHINHDQQMLIEEQQNVDIDLETLRKYISYAKAKVHPRLTERAAEKIKDLYVEDRKLSYTQNSTKKNRIPITVRQLEAIIRLSESIAKISLNEDVTEEHINKAHELFQFSTMNAIQNGKELGLDLVPVEIKALSLKIEESIKKRVAINSKCDRTKLQEEMVNRWGNAAAVQYTISNMIKNQEFQQNEGKKVLIRIK